MKHLFALLVIFSLCDSDIQDTKAAHAQTYDTIWLRRQGVPIDDMTPFNVTTHRFKPESLGTNSGTQTGDKVLANNRTWISLPAQFSLPSQTGNAGKPLITNGTTPSWGKKQEIFSGTTNGSGLYTVTFSGTYSVAPNVQVAIQGDFASYTAVVSSKNTTTATVKVYTLSSILSLGLVPQYSTVASVPVDVVITEK